MAEGKAKTKAPALTLDNVTKAVEGVKDWRRLGAWLNVPDSKLVEIERKSSSVSEHREKVILFWWENDPTPSWRRILWALDQMKEDHTAESMRQYCEPLTDPTLTRDKVITTLHTVPTRRLFWGESLVYQLGVPYSKDREIRDQSIPEDEKRTAAVDYWLGMVPQASWQHLAGAVYFLEEEAALEEARKYFQRPRDLTLTLNSLHTSTKGVRDWMILGNCIDVPWSKQNEIKHQFSSDDQRLRALLEVWLHTHPAPTWSLIAEALYQIEEYDLLKSVREQYITGPLEIEKRLAACERAMKEKGSMDQTVMQGVFLGQPRSGKSSLMKRLVRRPLTVDSVSTGVAESVLRVEIRKVSSTTVQVSGLEWSELGDLDDEAIALLQEMPNTEPTQEASAEQSRLASPQSDPNHQPGKPPERRLLSALANAYKRLKKRLKQPPTRALVQQLSPASFETRTQEIFQFELPQQFFRKALEAKKRFNLEQYLSHPWMLYLTDAGGQPEFQELLPALVSGPSVFFLVFRLDADLSKRFPVVYVSSTGESTVPYESSFTVEDNLLQSLASIASSGAYTRPSETKRVLAKPKVFFVGTHKDLVSEEKIKQIDRHLQLLVRATSHFQEGIVRFASETSMIFTINNLSEDETDVQQIRVAIERLGRHDDDFRLSTPYPWLIFGIIIRQMNVPLLSTEECFEVAQSCNIDTQEDLDNALWFHHTQTGILRHFQSEDMPELRDIVFQEPRYLFDCINNLIIATFTFENAGPAVREEFIKKGIFPADVFEEITARDTSELLPPAKRLKLFEYLHIIAALEENGVVTKYFMPCILAHAEASEAAQSSGDHCSPLVPPLMISFASGYCPKGLFGSLVVYLLGKRPQSSLEWELVEEQIFRDQISLSVSRCDNVVLKLLPTHLSIGITCSAQSSTATVSPHNKAHLATMCSDICQCIENSIEKVSQTLHYKHNAEYYLAFACPEVQNGEETHPAAVRHDLRGRYLQCTRQPKNRWDLPPDCLIWFTQEEERAPVNVDPTPASRNTLSSAIALVTANTVEVCDVLTECGFSPADWEDLAVRLSKDIDVKCIRQDESTSTHRLRVTIRQWLQKDTEASWRKLANAVAKISDYGDVVADKISRIGGSQ